MMHGQKNIKRSFM